AKTCRGLNSGESKPGIVHLGVEVFNSAKQTASNQGWKGTAHSQGGKVAGSRQIMCARQHVIHPQADPALPARQPRFAVKRQAQAERPYEMRSVLQQPTPLVQRLIDQLDVAVFKVAQPAVNELGGSGTGCGGEVALFDQGYPKAARRGIE